MKKHGIRVTILLFMVFPVISIAQNDENLETFTKEKNEQYPSGKFSGVEIENKHGDVSVKAWDKDSIRIDARAAVKAGDTETGEKIIEDISINALNNNKTIRFQTKFDEDFYSVHSFHVQYEVFLPANINIKVINRFGDINISSLTGRIEVDLEYGDLNQSGLGTADTLEGKISFASVQTGNLKNVSIELNNSDITLGNTGNVEISGKFYQADIKRADKLNVKTHTGRINTGKLKELVLKGTFCFASIGEIIKEGHIEINNGLMIIESVSDQLKKLSVNNDNAPLNLTLPESLTYTLHGEVINGQFRHYRPNEFKIIKDMEKTSFSGENQAQKQRGASIVLFNKNAGINIKR